MKVNLTESQYKAWKKYLKENAESDSQKKAIKYAMDNMGFTKEAAENYIRVTLRDKLRILTNNKKAGKFTLGTLRLYIEECDTQKDIRNLYGLIQTLANDSELYKKYDRNFNNETLEQLVNEIEIKEYVATEDEKTTKEVKSPYKVYPIDDFKDSNKFSPFVSWCLTKSKSSLESYNDHYLSKFYFVVKDGFEEMKSEDHMDELLLGEYGLSMLAICVNSFGNLKSCTCRWNHNKGGNDHILGIREIENITGYNFKDTFKPNPKSKEFIEKIDMYEELIKEKPASEVITVMKEKGDYRFSLNNYDYFTTLNLLNTFIFVYKRDNLNKPILKLNLTTRDKDFIFIFDSLIYSDNKTDMFVKMDYDGKKTYLNNVKNIYPVYSFDTYSGAEKLILEKEDSTIITDSDLYELFDFSSIKDFDRIVNYENVQTDEGVYSGIVDITYKKENDDKDYFTSIITRGNIENFDNCYVHDAINENIIVLRNAEDKCYTLLLDNEPYENVKDYNFYIYDFDSSNRYKYVLIEETDGSKILIKNSYDKIYIDSFKRHYIEEIDIELIVYKIDDEFYAETLTENQGEVKDIDRLNKFDKYIRRYGKQYIHVIFLVDNDIYFLSDGGYFTELEAYIEEVLDDDIEMLDLKMEFDKNKDLKEKYETFDNFIINAEDDHFFDFDNLDDEFCQKLRGWGNYDIYKEYCEVKMLDF